MFESVIVFHLPKVHSGLDSINVFIGVSHSTNEEDDNYGHRHEE